jgi:CRISPR type IV-associated DEAD/DEAH-box helicase Csf4
MPTISVRAPKDLSSKAIKQLLVAGLAEQDFEMESCFNIETEAVKIAIDAVQSAKIGKIATKHNIVLSDVASRIIYAQHKLCAKKSKKEKPNYTLDELMKESALEKRPGQSDATGLMRSALTGKSILMLESPTGSGKTLAELCAAVDAVNRNTQELVVIAVPTVQLMHQVESEYAKIQKLLKGNAPSIGYIVGSDKFVSVDALNAILDDVCNSEFIEPAQKWLRSAKLKANKVETGSCVSALPFQSQELYKEVPGIPPCCIDSSTDADDLGKLAYRAQFDRARDVNILVVTHSMLALDTKLKRIRAMRLAKENGEGAAQVRALHNVLVESGAAAEKDFYVYLNQIHSSYATLDGILPLFNRLIVDEAHLLEQSFSMMTSDDLSLYAIIRNPSLSVAAKTELKKLFDKLVQIGENRSDNGYLKLESGTDAMDVLIAMSDLLSKAKKKDEVIKKSAAILKSIIKNIGTKGFLATIDYSPVYIYPRVRCGATSVFMYMQFLWESVKSAAVVSATLLLPSMKDGWSASYTSMLLAVPKNREIQAIITSSEWLTSPVTVFVADKITRASASYPKNRLWLQPPSIPKIPSAEQQKAFDADHASWIKELSPMIKNIIETSQGGTLILLPSFKLSEEIGSELETYSNRLVVANKKTLQKEQFQKFMDIHRAGHKPIWLAVGGAWTGLNLVDDTEAQHDLLLTDLIIPRFPMRMNRSITHAMRVALLGWNMETNEVLMLLKQGIGRLVRREGIAHNRRIFILDSRFHDVSKFAILQNGIKKLLSSYKKPVMLQPICQPFDSCESEAGAPRASGDA